MSDKANRCNAGAVILECLGIDVENCNKATIEILPDQVTITARFNHRSNPDLKFNETELKKYKVVLDE